MSPIFAAFYGYPHVSERTPVVLIEEVTMNKDRSGGMPLGPVLLLALCGLAILAVNFSADCASPSFADCARFAAADLFRTVVH